MENAEIKMSESESMQLITSMINKAKNFYGETDIICDCIFFKNQTGNIVWLLIYLVLIFQVIYTRRIKRFERIKTYTRDINGFVWISFFICLMLTIFICVSFKRYELINPLLLILYGMPTFLSEIIIKFKPYLLVEFFAG